jgi:D-alanine transaminase
VGIPVDETPFTTAELLAADEVLITSSTTFCVAADAVDGTPVGGRDPQRLHAIQSTLLEDFKKYSNLG